MATVDRGETVDSTSVHATPTWCQ